MEYQFDPKRNKLIDLRFQYNEKYKDYHNKAVLEPRVSPAFAITYFAIIVILDLKIHQSMWIHWPFFPKTWTKGHWPLDDLWPHVCWGHMCDSTQGSLCPSPMTILRCMSTQWSILQNTTYIHTHTTYILHTCYVQNEWSHSLLLNSVQARQKAWSSFKISLGSVWGIPLPTMRLRITFFSEERFSKLQKYLELWSSFRHVQLI